MLNVNNDNNDSQIQLLQIIENVYNSFYVITLNKKGNLLVGGDFDGNMFLYDNLSLIKSYKYHKNYIITLKFSSSGKYLASGSADRNIGIIEYNGNQQVQFRLLSIHSAYVMKVDFSPNELYLISVSSDKQLLVINPQTGQVLQRYSFSCGLNFGEFITESKFFLYGSLGSIKVINFPEIKKIEKFKYPNYQIKQIGLINSVSNSQLFLVNGDLVSQTYLMNYVSLKILRRFQTESQNQIINLHLSDSKAIMTTNENIEVINWITAKLLYIIDSNTSLGTSLLSNDGKYLYAISREKIKIWVLRN